MPTHYKRRRTGGSRLTWSSYKLGQLVDRAAAVEREDANWQRAQAVLSNPDTSGLVAARDAQGLRGMAGRGAYWGKVAGGALGTAAGNYFGLGKAGGSIGAKMGDWASDRVEGMFRGHGLYQGHGGYTHSNALVSGVSEDSVHQAQAASYGGFGDEQGAIVIRNKEYVQDVYAPGVVGGAAIPFSNLSFPLNPGLSGTFTFLAQIAQNYDEYKFGQLLFTFRSTTTDIGSSSNGQCGTVIMCTNYNSAAPKFTDKQTMIEYSGAHSCKLTEHMVHGVECDPAKSAMSESLYVRSNPVVTGQDLKTYDKGLFQFAVANAPASFNGFPIGELWVEYTVTLRKPKLYVARGLEIDQDVFLAAGSAAGSFNGLCGTPLGSNFSTTASNLVGQQNSIGCAVYSSGDQLSSFVTSPFTQAADTAKWFAGSFAFAAATALTANQIAIVFPAAYVGNVAVTLEFSTNANVSTAAFEAPYACASIGNIVPIRDVYAYNSSVGTGLLVCPHYMRSVSRITAGVGDLLSYTVTFHMFVGASSAGLNNVFMFQTSTTNAANDQAQPGVGQLTVNQYQAYGFSASNARMAWVGRVSGTAAVPFNTVA